jgi:hypothetical protein
MVTAMERPGNRLWRYLLLHGRAPRAFALPETTGRRTGSRRHTPVGNSLDGDTFWLAAAHGTQAGYVRNGRHAGRGRGAVQAGLPDRGRRDRGLLTRAAELATSPAGGLAGAAVGRGHRYSSAYCRARRLPMDPPQARASS